MERPRAGRSRESFLKVSPAYEAHTAVQPSAAAAGPRRVSVIVLNYNGAAVIRRCLDKLLLQSYPSFEIVVVDNHSTDASPAILEEYAGRGVRVVRSPINAGVPGGRNLGLDAASGEIIAFIDNDGYADPDWLSAAVRTLESDARIGAVASVVFFANRRIVLNACGGTINRQGYGGDFCYHAPYEYAEIPHEVLFAMGCGIVVRKDALVAMGRFDALPIKWYEDVELGIWLWSCGYKVVVAPDAWIDHGWGHSDAFLPARAYMCERARVRTVLKYYPARHLAVWLAHELPHFVRVPGELRPPLLKAWIWNLAHLVSALGWRRKIRRHKGGFWHLMDPSWGQFPPPVVENGALEPDPSGWRASLKFDGSTEMPALNFGWHCLETSNNGLKFRWTDAHASAFFKLANAARNCHFSFFATTAGPKTDISMREVGSLEVLVRFRLTAQGKGWEEAEFPCSLPPGSYEMLIEAIEPYKDEGGRTVGLVIHSIDFNE
jgi:GT2 family glycosyltransferase